jgi:RNA polymerase sigma factor (TIGR02999 family)
MILEMVSGESQSPESVTRLLVAWRGGDAGALDRLTPLIYSQLHAIARRYLRAERPGHTLSTTALVHEAFIKLIEADIPWQDRCHFLAIAARQMRRILVDHARARDASKRGARAERVTLDEAIASPSGDSFEIIALDTALGRLERQDQRMARLIELLYFGGLTYDEAAAALGISPATVDRDHRMAKAWLAHELGG